MTQPKLTLEQAIELADIGIRSIKATHEAQHPGPVSECACQHALDRVIARRNAMESKKVAASYR